MANAEEPVGDGLVEKIQVGWQKHLASDCHGGMARACRELAEFVEHAWAASIVDDALDRGSRADFRLEQTIGLYTLGCEGGDEPSCHWLEGHTDPVQLPSTAEELPTFEPPLPVIADLGASDVRLTSWGWMHEDRFLDGVHPPQRWLGRTLRTRPRPRAIEGETLVTVDVVGDAFVVRGAGDVVAIGRRKTKPVEWTERGPPQGALDPDQFDHRAPDDRYYALRDGTDWRIVTAAHEVALELQANRVVLGPKGLFAADGKLMGLGKRQELKVARSLEHVRVGPEPAGDSEGAMEVRRCDGVPLEGYEVVYAGFTDASGRVELPAGVPLKGFDHTLRDPDGAYVPVQPIRVEDVLELTVHCPSTIAVADERDAGALRLLLKQDVAVGESIEQQIRPGYRSVVWKHEDRWLRSSLTIERPGAQKVQHIPQATVDHRIVDVAGAPVGGLPVLVGPDRLPRTTDALGRVTVPEGWKVARDDEDFVLVDNVLRPALAETLEAFAPTLPEFEFSKGDEDFTVELELRDVSLYVPDPRGRKRFEDVPHRRLKRGTSLRDAAILAAPMPVIAYNRDYGWVRVKGPPTIPPAPQRVTEALGEGPYVRIDARGKELRRRVFKRVQKLDPAEAWALAIAETDNAYDQGAVLGTKFDIGLKRVDGRWAGPQQLDSLDGLDVVEVDANTFVLRTEDGVGAYVRAEAAGGGG